MNPIDNDPSFIRHSPEMQDIITATPSRLIRWGMFLFFCVFVTIIALATFIHSPDMIYTTLKINNNSLAEILIPQDIASKVHVGQQVLINFRGYKTNPDEIFKGKITRLSNSVDNNGTAKANVLIEKSITDRNLTFHLKPGMQADARIIIQDVSILKRICKGFLW